MRVLAAALLAAFACTFAATAAAENLPPIGLNDITVIKIKPAHAKSCSAHARSKSTVGKLSRKLRTVACEQPLRPNLLDTGVVLVLRP
jgi:hypothetical protein